MSSSYRNHGYFDTSTYSYQDYVPGIGWSLIGGRKSAPIQTRDLQYQFSLHSHPYVEALIKRLVETSIKGLQDADTEYKTDVSGNSQVPSGKPESKDYELYEEFFQNYAPSELVPNTAETPHPVKELDFTSGGAYSVYNWELFYHIPITVAIHLSKNQRFEEAQRWFHYIFDPTDDSPGPTPERFWKVKPFQTTEVKLIEEILVNLVSGADPVLQKATTESIGALKDSPFKPHVVARYRQSAYMFKAIMAYLDNLIAWGDSLFRQDTVESINEATQIYVMAANILGTRPQVVPKKKSVRPQTYDNLKKDLAIYRNARQALETSTPADVLLHPGEADDTTQLSLLTSIGRTLYFCVPPNDKLLSYWNTVGDRLFKIRNSLNIQGIFRQLPLFEPPIDPAMLARAAAAGVDVGAAISGAHQPLSLVRFQLLIQKAAEICQEVKSLGNSLLSAIEKEDNEAIALLRARHEKTILELTETIKYQQWQEAIKNREGLEKSLANAAQRYVYYERLLGENESDITIPEIEELDASSVTSGKFKSDEPEMDLREVGIDIAPIPDILTGGLKLSTFEALELGLQIYAQFAQNSAYAFDVLGALASLIPQGHVRITPFGLGAGVEIGGEQLAKLFSAFSAGSRGLADYYNFGASMAAKVGSYSRRQQDWTFQSNLAAGEMTQIYKQLRAAQIRENIAKNEWENHKQQIEHSREIERFLQGEEVNTGNGTHRKVSTQALYTWTKREVKGLYGQFFQFAFDIAKKAERALQHELGDPVLSYLQFGYLAGKEGLLAGEKLYLDIKKMEMAYHDLNKREYELIKHVSLLQLDPLALLTLRATGRCTVSLPEELFDLDCPGHFFRRIKSVAISIPCVVGPYTSINCTLTLLKSRIRKTAIVGESYARESAEDPRFDEYFGSLQSIVTSTGQNDSGLFETNLRDERYLPFEGSGVISEWQLELPQEVRQFDYDTISDVILHLRYTAREGGALLRDKAATNLNDQIKAATTVGSTQLLSVRHEFPSAWAKFQRSQTSELEIDIEEKHFPYWSKGRLKKIIKTALFIQGDTQPTEPQGEVEIVTKESDGTETSEQPQAFGIKFKLDSVDKKNKDLWIALTWGQEEN